MDMWSRPLDSTDILAWADLHYAHRGVWPKATTGSVLDGPLGLNWSMIDAALRIGLRSLRGGDSLAKLLQRERGVRNVQDLPPLTSELILQWCDRYYCK